MKKSILIIFAILITSSSVRAQMTFGVKAGYNFSAFYKNMTDYSPGRNFGFYADKHLTENTFITIEFNKVFREGVIRDVILKSYGNPNDVNAYDFNVKTDFFEIPLIIKYNYLLSKHINLRPFIGYSFSITIEKSTTSNNSRLVPNEDLLKNDLYGSTEYGFTSFINGVIIGLSSTYRKRLLIDLRSVFGLNKFGGEGYVEKINYGNYSFEVSFGFIFGTQTKK